MGEVADMMLNGFLDCETGEYIDGEEPGYPRTMRDAWGPKGRTPAQRKARNLRRARARSRRAALKAQSTPSTQS